MRTQTNALLAAVLTLAAVAQPLDQASARRLFTPGDRSRNQGGEHFDTVMANYARRCTELDLQFTRESAGRPDSDRLRQAVALYGQGAAHCRGGAGAQGVDELSDAITLIGGTPHTGF
jgi:hypothetical protein